MKCNICEIRCNIKEDNTGRYLPQWIRLLKTCPWFIFGNTTIDMEPSVREAEVICRNCRRSSGIVYLFIVCLNLKKRKSHMKKNWTQTRVATFNRNGAMGMNTIAKTVFAPIYPVIAKNAITLTGINKGICLDLGSGPAMLSIAVAREAPEMSVVAVDFSDDSHEFALKNIQEAQLAHRIRTETVDVHNMPFKDNYANLIISRGSMFFWQDLKSAFQEIFRVLAPGGATYIGGGFGSLKLKEQVVQEMLKLNPEWDCYAKKKTTEDGIQQFEKMFGELNCQTYQIIDDETGFWIVISKP